jgi:hypothetical protein
MWLLAVTGRYKMTREQTHSRYAAARSLASPTRSTFSADTFDLAARRRWEKALSMSHPKETPMKKLIIATTAALMLGAPLALAANTTTTTPSTTTAPAKPVKQRVAATSLSAQCTSLGSQFDKAEAKHKTDKDYKEALALRSEGKTLCTSHKQTAGIKKIEDALTMLGLKPAVKS